MDSSHYYSLKVNVDDVVFITTIIGLGGVVASYPAASGGKTVSTVGC